MTRPTALFDTPTYERLSVDEAHMLVMLGATDIEFQFVVHPKIMLVCNRNVFELTPCVVRMHREALAKGIYQVQYARKKA